MLELGFGFLAGQWESDPELKPVQARTRAVQFRASSFGMYDAAPVVIQLTSPGRMGCLDPRLSRSTISPSTSRRPKLAGGAQQLCEGTVASLRERLWRAGMSGAGSGVSRQALVYLFCFLQVPLRRTSGSKVAMSHVLAVIFAPEQTKLRWAGNSAGQPVAEPVWRA
jgi:hypothetical protein